MNAEEPIFLIVETSGRVGQVAVAQGGRLCSSRSLEEARRHARDLAPTVASLLAEKEWTPRSVQAVIVSRGPGSYTGLRVGIMSAKTFAYATGCVLLAVDTFAAIAQQAPEEAGVVEVVADAQQDKIYVQSFQRTDREAGWQPTSPLSIQQLSNWLAQRDNNVWVTGPGLHVHRPRLAANTLLVSAADWDPRPEGLLQIGWTRFLAGERDDCWRVEPLYLRPSAAEEQWQARSHA